MDLAARRRDAESEQLERDAFALLRHVNEVSGGDPEVEILASRLADAQGLDREYALRVIRFLEREGLVRFEEAGPLVSLTVPGAAYVEHLAWRRRSVRRRWS
jgi:DNA-binding IclR family transcriptional regulator